MDIVTLKAGSLLSSDGGVSTFNRELSIALAELGHTVTARITQPGGNHPLLNVSLAAEIPGIEDHGVRLFDPAGLPAHADVILGHSRWSGGAASVLRNAIYPQAQLVHVLHTSPDQLGRLQGHPHFADRNARTERALFERADLVIGVGPLLAEEARRLARQASITPIPVHELIPGVGRKAPPAYSEIPARQAQILVIGRLNEPVKGVKNAAEIVGRLTKAGVNVQLTVRGAIPDERVAQERALSELAGTQVWAKPYTSDPKELEQDLRGADLVLVPALHEDFGLVVTEAAGAGIPVLVGDHTGAGMLLADPSRVPPELGRASVVPGTSQDTELWARHATAVIRDLPAERQRALALQDHLTSTYTWKSAAQGMIDQLPSVSERGTRSAAQLAREAFPIPMTANQPTKADTALAPNWGSRGPVPNPRER